MLLVDIHKIVGKHKANTYAKCKDNAVEKASSVEGVHKQTAQRCTVKGGKVNISAEALEL